MGQLLSELMDLAVCGPCLVSVQPCDRSVTWNAGALHYSDEVQLIRELRDMQNPGEKSDLQQAIKAIKYIGKGTYTDCAIKRGIAEVMIKYVSIMCLSGHRPRTDVYT